MTILEENPDLARAVSHLASLTDSNCHTEATLTLCQMLRSELAKRPAPDTRDAFNGELMAGMAQFLDTLNTAQCRGRAVGADVLAIRDRMREHMLDNIAPVVVGPRAAVALQEGF